MHLGIKITSNRTATHFMDNSFVNLGEELIPTWEICVSCMCVCSRVCERERGSQRSVLCVCVRSAACVLMEGDTVTQSWLVCKHIRASSWCRSHDSILIYIYIYIYIYILYSQAPFKLVCFSFKTHNFSYGYATLLGPHSGVIMKEICCRTMGAAGAMILRSA